MRFRSTRYPSLSVLDIGIQFVDGEAEVTDPAHVERLGQLAHLGVIPEPAAAPAKPAEVADPEGEASKPRRKSNKPFGG